MVARLATLLFCGQERGAWFEELSERFREECDYRIEAQHQQRFAELWAGHPGIGIPRVVPELCTQRVLVSELASGQTFDDFVRSACPEARQRAGLQLWQFSLESIFRHGLFNADPSRNPNRFRMNVPRDWVLVNRLHWGLGSLLAALHVRAAFAARCWTCCTLPAKLDPPAIRPKSCRLLHCLSEASF